MGFSLLCLVVARLGQTDVLNEGLRVFVLLYKLD